MKLRIKYKTWLVPPGKAAWVIYPFMLFRPAQVDVSDRLFRHELEHVYQVRKLGWFRFYLTYIYYWLMDGYLHIPYEIEARAAENDKLTTVERFWKDGHNPT